MNETEHHLGFLRELTWNHIFIILIVLVSYRLLVLVMHRIMHRAAGNAPSNQRLLILRVVPIARLLIGIAGIAIIIPLLVESTFKNVVKVGFALAFALKDYASCMIAWIVTIIENIYQPGDWIEVDGTYGEVMAIKIRAVHIVTADDTEVIYLTQNFGHPACSMPVAASKACFA
ncbi:mechanosensitive ion channel domain-containing protein [Methylobacter tundripaludum]|uniref:mechanosensitive ion channel domain-containing protein n=1 Tax=Methylobacter tundripaludum TaxID=173365 RepID=UPI00068CFA6F|nr:mechanosensitive ion channel domain-containing protein [Methylobacter tundripaludum]